MVKNVDKAQKLVKKARKLPNPLENLPSTSSNTVQSTIGEAFLVECKWASHLAKDISEWIFDLFRCNMKEMYMASQDGYDEHSKRQELEATTARFIVLRNAEGTPVGYTHFRFVVEDSHPVLYCYEIQIEKKYQSRGLGIRLLDTLQAMATKSGMDKVMATVFTFNEPSLRFFRKAGFEVDDFSPDASHERDYVILSKSCAEQKDVLKTINQ